MKTHLKPHFYFTTFLFQQTDHCIEFTNLPKIGCNCHQSRFYFLRKSDPPFTISSIKASEKKVSSRPDQAKETKGKCNKTNTTTICLLWSFSRDNHSNAVRCQINMTNNQVAFWRFSVRHWTFIFRFRCPIKIAFWDTQYGVSSVRVVASRKTLATCQLPQMRYWTFCPPIWNPRQKPAVN